MSYKCICGLARPLLIAHVFVYVFLISFNHVSLLTLVPQIASQRLADQIPLLIRYQMLQECTRQLQREMMQMLQDRDKIQLLLLEDSAIQTKREHLQSRLERLNKARVLLNEFSLNIFNFAMENQQGFELETKADPLAVLGF